MKVLFYCLMFLGLTGQVAIAQKAISGKVTDTEGQPLIGATVFNQNSTTGTVTDLEGVYSIEAKEGDAIEVSFTGYVKSIVKVGESAIYDVVLEEGAVLLNEVAVIAIVRYKKDM